MSFLIVLGLVAAVIALVAAALSLIAVQGLRGNASRVPELVEKIKILEARVAALEKRSLPPEEKPQAKPAPKQADAKPWDDFLADYNLLAASLDGPQKGQEACDRFCALRSIQGLICLDPAAKQDGKPAPKFVEVGQVAKSTFWAFKLPGEPVRYAVVPNPVKGYTKNLHEKGGMKETFASDFEEKDAARLQVKLPAIFGEESGQWTVVQPGIVKLLQDE